MNSRYLFRGKVESCTLQNDFDGKIRPGEKKVQPAENKNGSWLSRFFRKGR